MSLIPLSDHILFEDDYILVINKPAGLMVEPDRNNYPNLLWLAKKYLKEKSPVAHEPYVQHIHRLDRPVSGIILFAKQRAMLHQLSNQFAERKVRKIYKAITSNAPIERTGKLEHWHRKEKKKARLFDDEAEYTEKAILTYDIAELSLNRFLWTIELHTGKYHQIRAQLSKVGYPILGDTLYGSDQDYFPGAIALLAYQLDFYHPITNQELSITVPEADQFVSD